MRDTVPIRPATNQVLRPQNTYVVSQHTGLTKQVKEVNIYLIFLAVRSVWSELARFVVLRALLHVTREARSVYRRAEFL